MNILLIILIIMGLLLVVLAAICNSVMDTVDHHQSKSIFSKFKNQKWWNQKEGWKNKYMDYDGNTAKGITPRRIKWKIFGIKMDKPVQLTDSWHFFKMWMIIFICLAILIFPYTLEYAHASGINWSGILWRGMVWLGLLGLAWNKPFTWTYKYWFILDVYKELNKEMKEWVEMVDRSKKI